MINPGRVAPGASELSARAELSGRGATWGAPIGRILPQDKTEVPEILSKMCRSGKWEAKKGVN